MSKYLNTESQMEISDFDQIYFENLFPKGKKSAIDYLEQNSANKENINYSIEWIDNKYLQLKRKS